MTCILHTARINTVEVIVRVIIIKMVLILAVCRTPVTCSITLNGLAQPGGGGVLPYMGHIGMCGPKGYGFSAVLVINRVSVLADFGHFDHK